MYSILDKKEKKKPSKISATYQPSLREQRDGVFWSRKENPTEIESHVQSSYAYILLVTFAV